MEKTFYRRKRRYRRKICAQGKSFIIFSVFSVSSCKKIFPDLVLPFC